MPARLGIEARQKGSSVLFGYHGRYLLIDVSSGLVESVPLNESILRAYIGGVGLGAWLLLRHAPAGVDPLSASAPLILSFSPLVGGPLTTSAKFAVVSKSPLTDRINDSLCSSRFALAGKRTGYDALVVVGACERPSVLRIDQQDVRIVEADGLWGETIPVAQVGLEERFGVTWESLVIGPAGENLVRFATISHGGRHAGRGGTGAVMGAKRLKAIMVRGNRRVAIADPDRLGRSARALSAASLGPATEKYREFGTVGNLEMLNRLHTLPTRNFTQSQFSGAQSLSRESLAQSQQVVRHSCAACGIGCEHIFVSSSSGGNADEGVRLEYENVFALGPLCGISDPQVVRQASRKCDELGLDTISAGGTVALAMECAGRGWFEDSTLRFGDGEVLLRCLDLIAWKQGIGERLADGSRRFAAFLGGDAVALAAHVKGLEMPGYDPRTMQTLAVGLAVAARGADHNRSGAYQRDLSTEANRLQIDDRTPQHVVACEDEAALYDSLILCKFVRRALGNDPLAEMARLLRETVGWDFSSEELGVVASRVTDARHYFNWREGWVSTEDTLPERFFREPAELAGGMSVRLDRRRFGEAVEAYYRLRGWDCHGVLSAASIDRMLLGDVYMRT